MSQPPTVRIQYTYTGPANQPSLFDIKFVNNLLFGTSSYDAWCADVNVDLDLTGPAGGPFTATYDAKMYSIYELGSSASSLFPTIESPQNLDLVNWLFNQNFSSNGYTFQEVQSAAWQLLGDNWQAAASILGWVSDLTFTNNVNTLVASASNHNNYAPDITDGDTTNDNILLLLAPYKTDGTPQQPTLVQIKSAALGDFVWHDANANGLQDTGETGIAGVVVNLGRDLNNDGDITDLNELLQSTTTDGNGKYLFKGLAPGSDYQVQFFTPAGYDLASPRQIGADKTIDSDGALSNIVVLSAGEWNKTIDAGFYKNGSIGNYVWNDTDKDGTQDGGEQGIAGVKLILTGTTGSGQPVSLTTTTAPDGSYVFASLAPGSYQVTVDASNFVVGNALDGFNASPINQGGDVTLDSNGSPTGSIVLTSGQNDLTIDFGYHQIPATIGDRVWEDKNANGVQDSDETGIANVTVDLKDSAGMVIQTIATDSNGNYSFSVDPGTYSVSIHTPTGYVVTTPDQGGNDATDSDIDTTGNSIQTVLTAGEIDLTWDGGFYKTAELGDRVWYDSNKNGIQDSGEAGVQGVQVTLLDASGAAVGSPLTTGVNGNYLFTGLNPGTYSVQFDKTTLPAGYVITTQDAAGSTDANDSDANVADGKTIQTVLDSGESDRTWDMGIQATPATIGDRVWEDKNANGVQDSDETGIANVTVDLKDSAGMVIQTIATDSNGNYSFSVDPGTYSVSIHTPTGYVVTTPDQGGNDATDSDIDTTGNSIQTVLTAGEIDLTWDGGFYKTAELGDRVWYDSNKNGIQDSGEAGVQGVQVTLLDASGAAVGSPLTTGVNGNYLFTGLNPGTYSVQFDKTTLPAGYSFTGQDQGANDAVDSDANVNTGATIQTVLDSGESDKTWDAGIVANLAKLGDTIWYDKNANGIQDTGEAGIGGVKVTLTGGGADGLISTSGDNTASTTTTDSNGLYLFDSLTPGTQYQVAFDMPSGFNGVSPRQQGGDAAKDSDGVLSDVVVLTSGQFNQTIDAGFYKAGIDIEKWVHSQSIVENSGGGEGLTPGFWKNHSSYGPSPLKGWPETGHSPDDSFESIFGVNVSRCNPTLLQALGMNGGGENALLRHSAAALLNASDPYVDYAYTVMQVIAMTQAAYTKGTFEATKNLFATQNELGADLTDLATSSSTVINGLDMDADLPGSGPTIGAGDKAVFTYMVTNTGDTALGNVMVTDNRLSGVTYVGGDDNHNGLLDLNETWIYTASETVNGTGEVGNIGTVTGKSVVSGGSSVTDSDAAYYKIASIAALGDRVWEDTNANGIQDAGENGIANITVKLLSSAGAVLQTTTTDANGKYGFNVDAGSYKVQVVNPTGYYVTKQDQGLNDSADSDINTSGMTGLVTVAAGEQNRTIDAGLYLKASVGDKVWDDMNHNNIQDVSESGIGNITVKLLSTAGAVLATTLTNASGNYLFANLNPGSYMLEFNKANVQHFNYGAWYNMSGWKWAVKDTGSNDAIDSDVTGDARATTNVTVTSAFTLVSGQNDMTKDAGITPIVIDLNGDGIHTVSRANSMGTFDLLGNGKEIQSGWLSKDDGFLAIDSNGNGMIDNISELFGGLNKGDGFSKLSSFDSNGDGLVDAGDNDFASLKIWQDANGNHQTDTGELFSLSEAGVTSLNVNFNEMPFLDAQGNLLLERSSATLADGNAVEMTDVYFNVSAVDAHAAGVELTNLANLVGADPLWMV